MRLIRRPLAVLAPLALVACGGGDLLLPNEGQPATVKVISGDAQTGTILEPLHDSLVVKVTDRFGNPVAGVEIAWSGGGGGVVRPATAITGQAGMAATQRVLGDQPGTYTTTAVATALPDDGVVFTTTGVAARLALTTQPGATATSGAPFDPQPTIQLQDLAGNPLARPDVSVTVQIAAGAGTLTGTTSRTTGADGSVTFSDLAIAGAPGARTLIFAASGYASAMSTPISLGVGAPAAVAVAAGAGQSATAGTAVPVSPAVIVRDAGGTPVAGVPVSFAVTGGGGSVTGGTTTTGVDGVATVGSWTLGGLAGPNALQATVGADGIAGNPVTFSATGTSGPASAAKSSISASPGTIAASQGSVASTITIVLRDDRNNPLAGQAVTLSATGGGSALTQPGLTDASGTTTGTLSATATGPHVVTAVAGGVTVGSVTVTVTPGAPSAARTTVTVPAGTVGESTVAQIGLQDQFGNPVAGAAGQVAVSVSGANSVSSVKVDDRGAGSYEAAYTPSKTGTDRVEVKVGGQGAAGSPFSSLVAAGAADPKKSTADVPSEVGLFNPQQNPVRITVHVADKLGNPLGRGGDQVTVVVKKGKTVVAQPGVTDAHDGTYTAFWTAAEQGNNYKVFISVNGTEINDSPFTVQVSLF
jgi:Invasin, domain 3/Bacterial Ig-like domain (group 1)/Filamin/ABP280 repeat